MQIMDKYYKLYIGLLLWMLFLYLFCCDINTDILLFCKKEKINFGILIVQSITTQWMHFSIYHLMVNGIFGFLLIKKAEQFFSIKQFILFWFINMFSIGLALILFAHNGITYAGCSGIVLSIYIVLFLEDINKKKKLKENVSEIIDSIVLLILIFLTPGSSVLMHFAGIMTGAVYFSLSKLLVNKM